MRGVFHSLIVGLCLCLASVCQAETLALLIGVSDYDEATGIADLRGPPNDVRLLRQVLKRRGVTDIAVLADAVDGAARPTRAAILDAFGRLADKAGPGDFVFVHLSGHGTRQPDRNGDETDGQDEVFLTADTTRADAGTGLIGNALVDDDIGRAVAAIRARGAHVWLVMDSCHSGSGLRAGSGSARVAGRYVDPAVLGVSAEGWATPDTAQTDRAGPDPGGGVIAFYSAQSTEVAREVNLAPDGAPEQWYGLFTAKLAARLDTGADSSFRQVFQAVLRDMNDQSVPGAARLQTPIWEGDLIDAPLFGATGVTGPRRFAVTQGMLDAGLVHGLGTGTLVGLVRDVAAGADDLVGLAQLETAGATQTRLRAVASDCAPRSETLCASTGPVPSEARFAQVLARPVDATVAIAAPMDLTTGAPLDPGHPVYDALQQAVAAASGSQTVRVELTAGDFQVETAWDGRILWFGPRAVVGNTPAGLGWSPGDGNLAALLIRIARAEHLARLLDSITTTPSLLNPNPIRVTARLDPVRAADIVPAAQNLAPQTECRAANANRDPGQSAALPQAAELKQCDGLSFAAQGLADGARDVNRVHIDAQFCVHASHERIEGQSATRALGRDMTVCSDCPNGYSAGYERLFVVVSEARANAAPLNLEGLIETCGAANGTRSGAATAANAFLETLTDRRALRSGLGGMGVSDIWAERYNWTVLPKPEFFARAQK